MFANDLVIRTICYQDTKSGGQHHPEGSSLACHEHNYYKDWTVRATLNCQMLYHSHIHCYAYIPHTTSTYRMCTRTEHGYRHTYAHKYTYSIHYSAGLQDLLLMEKQTLVESDTRRGRLQNTFLFTQLSNINLHNSCKSQLHAYVTVKKCVLHSCAKEDPR